MFNIQSDWRIILTIIAGSGKDEYSSSTQKQSIDTVTTSRNTSLKQYTLAKSFHHESIVESPSPMGMSSMSTARYSDGNDSANRHACLSTKVTNAGIKILSDCNINEIHLNIFPPSATYVVKEPLNVYMNSRKVDDVPNSYLNINVHDRVNQKIINAIETNDDRRKMSFESSTHISLKRCDSLLHISIGKNSKVTKRHKRKSWLFANFWKLANRKRTLGTRNGFRSPQLSRDSVHRLSERSLNLVNDELMICINKRSCGECTSSDNFMLHNGGHQNQQKLTERDLSENFLKGNDEDENGANELDCYMNEIKRREMRWYEAWTSHRLWFLSHVKKGQLSREANAVRS